MCLSVYRVLFVIYLFKETSYPSFVREMYLIVVSYSFVSSKELVISGSGKDGKLFAINAVGIGSEAL